MPKKKKTLKQKMHTDQRRQLTTLLSPTKESVRMPKQVTEQPQQPIQTPSHTFALPTSFATTASKKMTDKSALQTPTTIATHEYSYLRGDLFKTFMLTCSIIVAELVIRFVFKT